MAKKPGKLTLGSDFFKNVIKTPADSAEQRAVAASFISTMPMAMRVATTGDVTALSETAREKTESGMDQLERIEVKGKTLDKATRLSYMEVRAMARGPITLNSAPARIEDSGLFFSGMTLDSSQEAAIRTIEENQFTCLIGAAGTGKTTMVKRALANLIYGKNGQPGIGIRQLSGDQGPSIAIVAFTGVATSVLKSTLPEWLHPSVKTIHSLLEYKPVDEAGKMFEPTRGIDNKLDHDLIIIDEASMVGLRLWHQLMDAMEPDTRIILIGDLNQLGPVADVPFFPYALSDGLKPDGYWKVAELTTVHRQTGAGANRIIETAHRILNGSLPEFDTIRQNTPWYVAGIQLSPKTQVAHTQIIQALDVFRRTALVQDDGTRDDSVMIYNPYQDLVLTTGNGHDLEQKGAFLMQSPLNDTFSRIVNPESETNAIYYVDAGRVQREFSVGDRVMCRKNESPGTKDRVTNGSVGVITEIVENPAWNGDTARFGERKAVLAEQRRKANSFLGIPEEEETAKHLHIDSSDVDNMLNNLAGLNTDSIKPKEGERQQVSSHIITVRYQHGTSRTYSSATDVANLQLAYMMTTHTAQGSQADTVFIVVHQAAKHQLNREWLYTGVTRARKRVVFLYTDLGVRAAVAKQQIFGRTLAEKVARYATLLNAAPASVQLTP